MGSEYASENQHRSLPFGIYPNAMIYTHFHFWKYQFGHTVSLLIRLHVSASDNLIHTSFFILETLILLLIQFNFATLLPTIHDNMFLKGFSCSNKLFGSYDIKKFAG